MMNLWNRKSVLAGLLILITLTAYIPAMQGGFVWDDDSYVTENPTLKSLHGLRQIWLNPSSTPQYYPLVFSSFWLEYKLWGLNQTGYHVVNVLLHALSALLLWRLLQWFNVPGAWLAAAVFALHPVHVESVAWVTERKNVLSAFFYLGSMFCLFRFFGLAGEKEDKSDLRWYVSGLLLFACALLSKTVTCTLPAAMLLILWWKRGKVRGRELGTLAPFFVLGLAIGLATAWLEQHHVGAVGSEWDLSFVERCLIAGRALWFYVGKLIWPSELIFNYPRWQIDAGVWWQYIYPAGVLFVVLLLWLTRERVGRGPLVGVLFFCGTLFPALGFFDVYPFRYSYVADHFQYLASIGLIALLVGVIASAASRLPEWPRRITRGSGLIVLVLLGVQTWHQGYVYRDIETLWADTLEKNPVSWMAHNNLGNVLAGQGRFEEAVGHYSEALRLNPDHDKAHYNLGIAFAGQGRFEEAISHYLEALRIKPDSAEVHNNLGVALAGQGKFEEAVGHYSEALRLNPDHAKAHNNLGNVLASQGRFEEAVGHYSEALRLKPDHVEAYYNLGNVLVSQRKFEEAIDHYSAAVRIKPDHVEAYYNLGNVLTSQGRIEEAIDHYYEALRIEPNNTIAHIQLALVWLSQERTDKAIEHYQKALSLSPDSTVVLNNLAWILATHESSRFRDGARSVQLAEKACTLSGYKNAISLDTLAAAYAEEGRFHEALQTAQKASKLAVAEGRVELAKEIERRMQLYKAGKPFYES
jgi:tetratricopeptide (TPR) repeat protein